MWERKAADVNPCQGGRDQWAEKASVSLGCELWGRRGWTGSCLSIRAGFWEEVALELPLRCVGLGGIAGTGTGSGTEAEKQAVRPGNAESFISARRQGLPREIRRDGPVRLQTSSGIDEGPAQCQPPS